MKYWKEFDESFNFNIIGKQKKLCEDIFTFDIETSNILKLNGSFLPASIYQDLDEKSQEQCEFLAFPYIWQLSVNETVYYGRTFDELEIFLTKLDNLTNGARKILFVHNLSFEFQFLCSRFNMTDVLARKTRHVMKCKLADFNFEMRCTYMMSNVALKILADTYRLPVKKLAGDLDYDKIRNSKTCLNDKELAYCENDCLVVYYYIKMELETYKSINKIPLTYTGHVRRELKAVTFRDYAYKNQVSNCINVDGHIYNLLIAAFQGRIYTCKLVLYK